MFIFRDPLRPPGSEALDPVQVERERRILFAPPGHPGPFPTYDEVRAELADRAARSAASALALTLAGAGFGPPVRVVVVHDLDGGIDRIKPFGKAIPTPPWSAEAEHFRPLGGAENGPENVECDPKHTAGEVLRNSATAAAEIVEVSSAAGSRPTADPQGVLTYIGKSETSPQPHQKLQRARTSPKPNPASLSVTGLTPKTKPKPASKSKIESQAKATARAKSRTKAQAKAKAKARSKPKPKRERTLTISPDQRAEAELCFFMAEALGFPFNMRADLNPGNLDDLSVEERIAFCAKIVGNLLAYARRRCEARGMPYSWWPPVWGWVRESERGTNLKEHVHLVFYCPEDERQHMIDLMEEKRKSTDPKVKRWCPNAKFALIDSFEHWTGAKFQSALGYFVKMANPQDYHPDSTVGYKKSGFITGPRVKFSPFLLDPDRVEAHRIDVQALRSVRDDNRAIMRANGSRPARDPCSLHRASQSAPADVHAEIVLDVPAAPILVPAVAEPEPIEPNICPTPGSAGLIHRDEAEHRGMDVVEVEVRPGVSAPVPMPRELDIPASVDAGSIPAAIEGVIHAEVAAPLLPTGAAFTPAVGPATATPADPIPAATVSPDVPAEAIAPTPAPAVLTPASSSPQTVLAALGRALVRGAAAGVGWIASRLGGRPAPPAVRRPRTPLFHPSTIPAAGAFFGCPDVQSVPW